MQLLLLPLQRPLAAAPHSLVAACPVPPPSLPLELPLELPPSLPLELPLVLRVALRISRVRHSNDLSVIQAAHALRV
eukprot:COSAG05_NODE_6_length_45604_cov_26.489660_16_plen_77_part_00